MQFFKHTESVFCALCIWSLCLFKCLDGYVAENHALAFRLPGLVMPELYELQILTNLDGEIYPPFYEAVSIIPVTDRSENTEVETVEEMAKYDQLRITLKQDLVENHRYKLHIKFCGTNREKVFYDTGYIIDFSQQIAFTKLDMLGARLLYPCFDQMNAKAKYKLYLGHAEGTMAYTNAKFVRYHKVPKKPDWTLDEFEKTIPMAPFSVGIALLSARYFSYQEIQNPSLLIRVTTPDSSIHTAEEINNIFFKIFKFFSKLFLLARYPFRKLEIIVFLHIRDTINTIDSYGLIFMREMYVFNALQKSESSSKFEALSEMCILMSQQWMGHSVTMSRYEEIWLHEGLNLYLQTMCVNEVFSEMEYTYSESYVVNSFLHILRSEENQEWVFVSTRNPTTDVRPNNLVSKQKTFHLIRMMSLVLGPTLFRQFLAVYLQYNKSANTSLDEVWHVFSVITDKIRPNIFPEYVTAERMMQSWTSQKGHPLVTVTRDYETGEITIEQKPFILYEKIEKENLDHLSSWIIPLTYTTQKKLEFDDVVVREWLIWEGPKLLLDIKVEADEWIIFNLNLEVMVRVNYDATNWEMIQSHLLHERDYSQIPISARVRLISDMFVLAEAGEIFYRTLFKTMNYLTHEKYYLPWEVALAEFALIRSRLIGTKLLEHYQEYMREILDFVFRGQLPLDEFENLYYQQRKFKISIIEASCLYEVEACVDKSLKVIQKWGSDSSPLWPDSIPHAVNQVIHCQKVKSDNTYWWYLWKQFRQRNVSTVVKRCILLALGCSRDSKILKRYLKESLNQDKVFSTDSLRIFQSLIPNDKGYKVMKKFFMKNYERISKLSHVGPGHYLVVLLEATTTEADLQTLIAFVKKKKLNLNDKTIKNSIAKSKGHIQWFNRHKFGLEYFFKLRRGKKKNGLKSLFKWPF